MFERRAEFEVVFAPWKGLDPDPAVRLAVAWWQRQPGEHLGVSDGLCKRSALADRSTQ